MPAASSDPPPVPDLRLHDSPPGAISGPTRAAGTFFDDPACFAALRDRLPALLRHKGPQDTVRVWVPACGTGEEAYSIAMLLSEFALALETPPALQVFATDLAPEAIRVARQGLYPTTIRDDVDDERLRRFFVPGHGVLRVRPALREMVMFAVHDALRDLPFAHLDLVDCRHLLAGLTPPVRARLCDPLHFALRPHGLLFLGMAAGPLADDARFTAVDAAHGLYARAPAPVAARAAACAATSPGRVRPVSSRTVPPMPTAWPPAADAAAPSPSVSPSGSGSAGPDAPWGRIHLGMLEQLGPPSILVDAAHDIVHLSPSAGRWLKHPAGEPERNLMRLVPRALRIELRAALHRAARSARPVEIRVGGVAPADGADPAAPLVVRVVPLREGSTSLYLVLFGAPGPQPEAIALRPAAEHPGADELDREIAGLREQLGETVRRHERSTSELVAGNEELQTINEELRSATEDLRASREELQSFNEEFVTVNRELKAKVDELAHANSDLQNLMNATAIATLFLDRDLRIARYTPMAVTLFDLIPDDIGRPLADLTPHLRCAGLAGDAARVLERLTPMEREVGLADGTWFLARLLPYRTMEDRIAGVVLSFIDITERKRAEEVSQWLSAVVASSMDAIISFSLQGTILSWNGGARRVFGHVAEEMIGRPLSTLAWDGQAGWCEEMLERVQGMRSIDSLETLGRARAGHVLRLAVTASPIVDIEGRAVGGTASLRDISEARRNEEALRRSQDELLRALAAQAKAHADLERADSAKDRFLAVLSHELRNPLAAVTTASELLALPALPPPERARATALIQRQARTMTLLLDDLLDVSRLAVGRFALRTRDVDLAEVVEPALEAVEAAVRAAGHRLALDLPAAPVRLHVDPLRITQVLVNLLGNATKYTPPGGEIGLRVHVERDMLCMVVSDDGVGIAAERLDQIFELYTQGPLATHALNDGLGVGLSLARTIVGLHRGTVEGASDGPGRGSRFTIRLPLRVATASRPPVAAPAAPAVTPREILVADDNADAAWTLSQVLRRAGHRTRVAGGGAEALESAGARAPDVAVLDIGMPDIDGVEVARRLRAAPATRDIVLIALTGWSSEADRARAVAAGFDALLSKPAGLRELLAAMDAAAAARHA
jgi:two-component system CheB/CheR fusion protein